MANTKMMNVSIEILKVMTEVFQREHLDFMFCGLLNPGDVVEMVMLDLIKKAYDKTEQKYSLRHFYEINGITEMDQIMRYSRIQSYVMKWRQKEFDRRTQDVDVEIFKEMNELLPPDMSEMKTKLEGYKLTEMNFFELTTIMDNEFTKSFTEKRLIDSKKISNKRFQEIMNQFDGVIDNLNDRWLKSIDDTVFATLAAFTLEWKYPINFIYAVAKKMEELGISEFPDQKSRLTTFCGDIHYESILQYKYSTHSRMITVRDRYIELMLTEPKDSLLFGAEQTAFLEGLGVVSQLANIMTIDNVPILEWFIINTTKKDWASFFMDYDLFMNIHDIEKSWTNKRIRYFRECLSMILTP